MTRQKFPAACASHPPRRALSGRLPAALRETFKAGPSANMSVPSKQNPNVAANIAGLGPLNHTISSGISLRIEPTSRSDDHSPRISPPTPPSTASAKPSVRSWRTIRQRLPPSARRIAISLRRAVPRASSMLARLRHATKSTTTAIPSSNGAIDFYRAVCPRSVANRIAGHWRGNESLILLLDWIGPFQTGREPFERGSWPRRPSSPV